MLPKSYKNVLKQLVKKLKENNIQFQLTGGIAAIAYGAKRIPYDIDIDTVTNFLPVLKKEITELV